MAGADLQQETDCNFEWDETSQLYCHASSGFYHDPQAGWYYSSRDGLYYKFENGNYVLLGSKLDADQPEILDSACKGDSHEAKTSGEEVSNEPVQDPSECNYSDQSEYPPPPSEWLEDTLIDMYLSGYSNLTANTASSDVKIPLDANNMEKLSLPSHGGEDTEENEEGEWIPDDPNFLSNLSKYSSDEGMSQSQEEENWRAQYGQICQIDERVSDFHVVNIWDWALVKETKKDGKTEVSRLVGRLMKHSLKFHPAVPSGGGKLKTAPICDVYLDMVRVTTGRIYRLKIPSLQYVTSLSTYDASNPTKDWDFPKLSMDNHTNKLPNHDQESKSQSLDALDYQKDMFMSSAKPSSSSKDHIYRDRAAERRALHGGFGVGIGQKSSVTCSDSIPSSPNYLNPEEAASEALNNSFGERSYARKILENMGWKEGEALGGSMKGLTEPIQAIGNNGNAGLGWNNGRRK
ncbi:LOW QUALITY PROTEIN: uncharacterized protein LOC142540820 [Primulina tabacum]|uniref:LOW QUALITY PROTEIN: uncharacterized protein LOC142540820 n=1 Tax=Primulina tabacum TaxID=48773 RepID=UPI003F5A6FD7